MKTIPRRALLPYGYVAFTGKVLSNPSVDQYNTIQREINTWIDDNRPVPEHLMDASHSHFALAAGAIR